MTNQTVLIVQKISVFENVKWKLLIQMMKIIMDLAIMKVSEHIM